MPRNRPGKRERKEATVADTQKPGSKKPHWIKEARAKSEALDALMKEAGVDSVDALREHIASKSTPEQWAAPATGSTYSGGASIEVREWQQTEVPEPETGPAEDCLGFITADTPYVGIVSSTSTFVLRPQNDKMQPPMTRVSISSQGSRVWAANPFIIRDENRVYEQNIRVMKAKWHHYRVTRELAESIWSDERHRRPTTAVMDPTTFVSWDQRAKQAIGKHEPITEFVPLRELVRYLLTKGRETYLDYTVRPEGLTFDPRVPNPYRNKIVGVAVEIRGDLTPMQRERAHSSA